MLKHPNEMTNKELDSVLYPAELILEGMDIPLYNHLVGKSVESKADLLCYICGYRDRDFDGTPLYEDDYSSGATVQFHVALGISRGLLSLQQANKWPKKEKDV